jgi:hypothetical protein
MPVEEVAADEVQGKSTGRTCQRGEAIGEPRQLLQQGVAEGLVGQEEQLGRRLLGQDVDRDSEVGASTVDADLEVGTVGSALRTLVEHPADQYSVVLQRHFRPRFVEQSWWSAAGSHYRCRAAVPSS